jgi:uncharacterized cupin superfamily protein
MHATATVGYEYVLEGEVVTELDDAEVTLRPGDAVVQNGTRHAWRNRSDTTARLIVVMVGANHSTVLRAHRPTGGRRGARGCPDHPTSTTSVDRYRRSHPRAR